MCLANRRMRNNPNVAVKYCIDCWDRSKKYFCLKCDEEFHRVGPTKEHLRRLLVIGAGVRKKILARGDGVYFPLPMDQVRCKVQCRIFHEGNMIKRMDPTYIDFMAGLSGPCVHVQVLGCKNIMAADFGGSSDPYVVAMFQGKKLGVTRVRPRTLNPRWVNESFIVPTSANLADARNMPRSQRGLFRLEVYDYDWVGANDFLGNVEMGRDKLLALAEMSKSQPIMLPLTMQEFHGVLGIQLGISGFHVSIKVHRAESLDKFNAFSDGRPFVKCYFGDEYLGKTGWEYDSGAVEWTKNNEFRIKINDVLKREKKILKHRQAIADLAQKKFEEKVRKQRDSIRASKQKGAGKDAAAAAAAVAAEPVNVLDEIQEDKNNDKIFRFELFEYSYFTSPSHLGDVYFPIDDLRRLCPKLPKALIVEREPATYLDNTLRTQRALNNLAGNICCAAGGKIAIDEDDGDNEFWERMYPTLKGREEAEGEEDDDDDDPLMAGLQNRSTESVGSRSIDDVGKDAAAMLAASDAATRAGLTEENLQLIQGVGFTNPTLQDHQLLGLPDIQNASGMMHTSNEEIPLISYDLEQDTVQDGTVGDDITVTSVSLVDTQDSLAGGDSLASDGERPAKQPAVVLSNLFNQIHPSNPGGDITTDNETDFDSVKLIQNDDGGDSSGQTTGNEGSSEEKNSPESAPEIVGAGDPAFVSAQESVSAASAGGAEDGDVEEKTSERQTTPPTTVPPIDLTGAKAIVSGYNTPSGTGRSTGRASRPAPPPVEDETKDESGMPFYLRNDLKGNQNVFSIAEVHGKLKEMTESVAEEMVRAYRSQRLLDKNSTEVVNGLLPEGSLVGAGFDERFQPTDEVLAQLGPDNPVATDPALHDIPQFVSEDAAAGPWVDAPTTAQQQPPLTAAEKKTAKAALAAAKAEAKRLEKEAKQAAREQVKLDRLKPKEPEPEPEVKVPDIDYDKISYHKCRHYAVEKVSDKADVDKNENLGHIIVRLIPASRGNIIAGLDEGVRHMSLGETSSVKIRFDHAYNNYAMTESIPARSNLVFTVQLKSINGFGLLGLPLRIGKRIYRFTTFACRKTNDWVQKIRRDYKRGQLPHQKFKKWFNKTFASKTKVKEEEVLLDNIAGTSIVYDEDEEEEDGDDEEEELARREKARIAAEADGKSGHYMKKHITVSVVAGAKHLWTYREKVKLSKRKKGKKGGDVAIIEEEEEEELDEDGNPIVNELDQDNDEGYELLTSANPGSAPSAVRGSSDPSGPPSGAPSATPSAAPSTRSSFTANAIPGPVDVPGVAAAPPGNAFSGMATAPAAAGAAKGKPGPPGGKPAPPPK